MKWRYHVTSNVYSPALRYKVKATVDSNDHTFITVYRLKIVVTLPDMRHNGTVISTEHHILKQCLANIVNKKVNGFCHNDLSTQRQQSQAALH